MKRRNLLHTGIAAVLLLSTGACEDFKFGNAFLDKPFTTDITIAPIIKITNSHFKRFFCFLLIGLASYFFLKFVYPF